MLQEWANMVDAWIKGEKDTAVFMPPALIGLPTNEMQPESVVVAAAVANSLRRVSIIAAH